MFLLGDIFVKCLDFFVTARVGEISCDQQDVCWNEFHSFLRVVEV